MRSDFWGKKVEAWRNFLVVNKFEFAKLNYLHDETEGSYVLSIISNFLINIRMASYAYKFRSIEEDARNEISFQLHRESGKFGVSLLPLVSFYASFVVVSSGAWRCPKATLFRPFFLPLPVLSQLGCGVAWRMRRHTSRADNVRGNKERILVNTDPCKRDGWEMVAVHARNRRTWRQPRGREEKKKKKRKKKEKKIGRVTER